MWGEPSLNCHMTAILWETLSPVHLSFMNRTGECGGSNCSLGWVFAQHDRMEVTRWDVWLWHGRMVSWGCPVPPLDTRETLHYSLLPITFLSTLCVGPAQLQNHTSYPWVLLWILPATVEVMNRCSPGIIQWPWYQNSSLCSWRYERANSNIRVWSKRWFVDRKGTNWEDRRLSDASNPSCSPDQAKGF